MHHGIRSYPLTLAVAGTLLLLFPLSAGALPPDRVFLLPRDGDRIVAAPAGDWTVVSSDPKVLRALYFDTAEVSLEIAGPGTAIVFLVSRSIKQVVVWQVRIAEQQPSALRPDPRGLQKPCGCGEGGYPLSCRVRDAACLDALHAFLDGTDLTVQDVLVIFTVPGAQALLARLEKKVKAAGFTGVQLAFAGANLRLRGKLPNLEAWISLIKAIYPEMVGGMILDDQIEIGSAPPPSPPTP